MHCKHTSPCHCPSRFCPYRGLLLFSLLDLHTALPLQLINGFFLLFIGMGAGNQASSQHCPCFAQVCALAWSGSCRCSKQQDQEGKKYALQAYFALPLPLSFLPLPRPPALLPPGLAHALPLQLIYGFFLLFIGLGAGNQASGQPSIHNACRGERSGAAGTRLILILFNGSARLPSGLTFMRPASVCWYGK